MPKNRQVTPRRGFNLMAAYQALFGHGFDWLPFKPTVQSATQVLIWLSQILIVGWPPLAWLKLREADARSARLWFGGLVLITFGAMVLGLVQRANGMTGLTMVAGTCLFLESMRREAGKPPFRRRWASLPLAGLAVTYGVIEVMGMYPSVGVELTSMLLVLLEAALIHVVLAMGRRLRSRGLVIIVAGILPVFFINLARLAKGLADGQFQPLFSPTPLANAVVLSFTMFSLLATVGFLVYTLEKTHHRHTQDLEASTRVQLAQHQHHQEELRKAKEAAESLNRTLEDTNRQLALVATVDTLTGAWNRRRFEEVVAQAMEQAHRHALPLSLVIFDVDHFKRVNDTHGHQAGDRVLVELSGLARRVIRKSDHLFRWGGEEFMLLLADTGLAGACSVAEKLRSAIASEDVVGVGRLTASFGVATRGAGEPLESWIQRLDRALYEAKESGRNVVRVAS